jgi:hypothetical protein
MICRVWVCLAIVPTVALAQASIAGVVKDTSGAVLPGVTVEAASPALLEKVRTVVTDGTGQYRIESLRPGAYTVTFTLTGFNTMKRDGVELTGTFTASINAELRVGAVAETVTVTGETPIVDVQNTKQQTVITRELVREIPTSRNVALLTSLLPSVIRSGPDDGGLAGESSATTSGSGLTVHGNNDSRMMVNGLSVVSTQGGGTVGLGNVGAYQELQVDTSGISAEQKEGGVRMNVVLRDGGNAFHGDFDTNFADQAMQSSNFTPELQAQGLDTPNRLNQYKDINPSFGGPVQRDKLWFFSTGRYVKSTDFAPVFFNANAGDPTKWTYVPTTQAVGDSSLYKAANGRLTWQVTPKNKIGLSYNYTSTCDCPRNEGGAGSPEGLLGNWAPQIPVTLLIADWSAPLTNRLLLEAGFLKRDSSSDRPHTNIYFTHDPGAVLMNSVNEQSTGFTYRASSTTLTSTQNPTRPLKVSASYITGAHAFKVGFNLDFRSQDQKVFGVDSPISFRFNNGVPNQMTLRATPYETFIEQSDHGAFVQDRWTVHRFTVSAGLRYDYLKTTYPATTVGPTLLTPTRNITFPETDGVRWNDLEPRLGLVYDLFGNGKTALKVSANKYLATFGSPNAGSTGTESTFTTNFGPVARLVNSTTRSWTDSNRNFVPDCNVLNPAAQNLSATGGDICGAMANANFGTTQAGSTFDPATLTGWNKRPDSSWQFSAGVQRELLPRVAVDVSYFRTIYTNRILTDNRSVLPSENDYYSITAPLDSRLPGGGGYTVSGLVNVKPSAFGRAADNYVTFADNYGPTINHWNGVDATVSARLKSGLLVQGGAETGRTSTDTCATALARGTSTSFCHSNAAWLTQAKFIATYTIPRINVLTSATFTSVPGAPITATYTATNAIVAPSLGRNLSGGAANVTVAIVQPNTLYGDRWNTLALRVGKVLKYSRVRTTASVDVVNVLNANTPVTLNAAFASWQQPQSILGARFARLNLRVDF